MKKDCIALAITGCIGGGKSMASSLLREMGVPVFDADACVHTLLEGDSEVLELLRSHWGACAVSEGKADRRFIAAKVFGDLRERLFLESILHPRVRVCCENQRAQAEKSGDKIFAAEIPLLFESGFEDLFDYTACLWVSEPVREVRLKARGMAESEIRARGAAQWPLEKKAALSDFVLLNDGEKDFLKAQLQVLQGKLASL